MACAHAAFADDFGPFLPLAGITSVKQIRDRSFGIKATGRLNKLCGLDTFLVIGCK